MDKQQLRIAFAGPSGLGKTTLGKIVSDKLALNHPSTSAWDVFSDRDKQYLKDNFGYTSKGHRNVINMSSSNPDFGSEFQRLLLEARTLQIKNNPDTVFDRCPIDNIVYVLSQVSHNMTEGRLQYMIEEAQKAYRLLTHVIIIRYSHDIPSIEDNSSRVPNRYFQQYISDVFGGVYARYFAQIVGPRVITLDFWDLKQREDTVLAFLGDSKQLKIPLT